MVKQFMAYMYQIHIWRLISDIFFTLFWYVSLKQALHVVNIIA